MKKLLIGLTFFSLMIFLSTSIISCSETEKGATKTSPVAVTEKSKVAEPAAAKTEKSDSSTDTEKTATDPVVSESAAEKTTEAGTDDEVAKKDEMDLTKVRAVIETKYGNIELKFFPDKAPGHVKNFIKLATEGYYDGTIFHRVIPNFMIQGGDSNTKGDDVNTYGRGGPGYTINAEFNDIPHKRGILSMARSRSVNSAGSQFFIVVKDSNSLDYKYTVFGEVVSGMDVVDKIVNLHRNSRDLPNERVEMKVKIITVN